MTRETGLLGAEKQAATSAALAYPEVQFVFYTDWPVIDGWDLPNVRITRIEHGDTARLVREHGAALIPLCPSWISDALGTPCSRTGAFSLRGSMAALRTRFGDSTVLPLTKAPGSGGLWIVKGNKRHKPDALTIGSAADVLASEDAHGCELVFQPYLEGARTYIATGVRAGDSGIDIALFRVYSEVFCREPVIAAAETVTHGALAGLCCDMLDHMDHRGWFAMNWLELDGTFRLSSLRPVPCATFGAMRRAGLDSLLRAPQGRREAAPGVRMIADNHYSSYTPLT
jgi:hypothetical protein